MLVSRIDVHLDPLRIASGHYAGSRRRADARSDVEVGELAALFRHAIQVWRAMDLGPKRLDVPVTEIIAEDDDEIWLTCLLGQTARRKSCDHCRHGSGEPATLLHHGIGGHQGETGYIFKGQAFTEYRSLIKIKLPKT